MLCRKIKQDKGDSVYVLVYFYFTRGGQQRPHREVTFKQRSEGSRAVRLTQLSGYMSVPGRGKASAEALRWEHGWHVRGTVSGPCSVW